VLGFVNYNLEITAFGYYSSQVRMMTLENKRMIFSGYYWGYPVLDLITLAAIIQAGKSSLVEKGFKMPVFMEDQDFYLRHFVRDTFAEALLVFQLFQEQAATILKRQYDRIMKNKPPTRTDIELRNWCEEKKINYTGIMSICQVRDEFLAGFVAVGLNPFFAPRDELGLLQSLRSSFLSAKEHIQRLKQCIYDGYCLRMLTWQPEARRFESVRKVPVIIKGMNYHDPPAHVVCSGFSVMESIKTQMFEVRASDFVSVMDNFVYIDRKV
jgi:hypothetical protein